MLFHVAPAVFPPALCMARAHRARHDAAAVVRGKVSVARMEHRRCAPGALQHSRCALVHPACGGHGATVCAGGRMVRQEVCHGLRDGACHREPAAVAQPQDKAAPAAARRPAWPHAAGAPSVLGTRAGGKSQVEASRVPLGADGAPGGVAQGGAVRKAMRAQALAPLGGCSGLARPPAANLLLTRSEGAGARAGLPGPAGLLGSPGSRPKFPVKLLSGRGASPGAPILGDQVHRHPGLIQT